MENMNLIDSYSEFKEFKKDPLGLDKLDLDSDPFRLFPDGQRVTPESAIKTKRQEIEKRKARIKNNAYTEIQNAVTRFADTHGIRMVINYRSSVSDPDDPKSVAKRLKNSVVFQRNTDITRVIIKQINRACADKRRE